jgi:hypothetical protein
MSVAFDAVASTSVAGSGGTTLSWTHTPVGTPTGVAVTLENFDTGHTVTGVTYGGNAMSLTSTNNGSLSSSSVQIWGLASPPAGAQTVVVTFSATGTFCGAGSVTVTGGDTTTLFSNHNSANGSSTASSVGVTSAVGELVIDIVGTNNGPALTVGGGQTQRWTQTESGNVQASSTAPGASGTVTMGWTLGFTGPWAASAASFKAAGSAAAQTPTLMLLGCG